MKSSANSLNIALPGKTVSRSLINRICQMRPRTERSGTPLSKGDGAERQISTYTCCELFAMKETVNKIKSEGLSIAESLWRNFVRTTESNAS